MTVTNNDYSDVIEHLTIILKEDCFFKAIEVIQNNFECEKNDVTLEFF